MKAPPIRICEAAWRLVLGQDLAHCKCLGLQRLEGNDYKAVKVQVNL